jgi:hypothetical protein
MRECSGCLLMICWSTYPKQKVFVGKYFYLCSIFFVQVCTSELTICEKATPQQVSQLPKRWAYPSFQLLSLFFWHARIIDRKLGVPGCIDRKLGVTDRSLRGPVSPPNGTSWSLSRMGSYQIPAIWDNIYPTECMQYKVQFLIMVRWNPSTWSIFLST